MLKRMLKGTQVAWSKVSGLEGEIAQLLRANHLTVVEIIRIDMFSNPGSVLYLAGGRSPYTAWIWKQEPQAPVVIAEPGFLAEPSRIPSAVKSAA